MSVLFAVLAILAGSGGAGHAQGEGELRLLIPYPALQNSEYFRKVPEVDRNRAITDEIATCMIRRKPDQVNKAVSLGNTLEGFKAWKALVDRRCKKSTYVGAQSLTYFGSLVRAKIINDFSGRVFVADADWRPAIPDQPPIVVAVDSNGRGRVVEDSNRKARVSLNDFAHCVIETDFIHASEFVIEPAGSAQENAALEHLSPVFAGCGGDGGVTKMTKNVLSQILTEALYNMVAVAREVQPDA